MAIETAVNIDVNVDGTSTVQQAANAYEDLGDAVSKTQLEAERLAHQFGINDARTQEAIKRAGQYKNEMEKLDFAIEGAKGGSQQLLKGTQAVVGGFEAAVGAMALFGGESEELEAALLKVQGAMALSQGLADLQEFSPALKGLGQGFLGALKSVKTFSRGTKIALASTGVGALIVAVGILIGNWDKLKSMLSGVTAEQEALNKSQEDYNNSIAQTTKEVKDVGQAFELARDGVISKEEALFQYNETLGDVLGTATSIEEAEENYIKKTDAYIKATALRKQADVLLEMAAKAQAEAMVANAENSLNAFDEFVLGTQKGFAAIIDFTTGGYTNLKGETEQFGKDLAKVKADELKTQKNAEANSLTSLAESLTREAIEIEKSNEIKSKSNENFRKQQADRNKKAAEQNQKEAEEQRKLAEQQAAHQNFLTEQQAKANESTAQTLAGSINKINQPLEMFTINFEKRATRQMGLLEKLGKFASAYGQEVSQGMADGLKAVGELANAFAGEDEARQKRAFEISKRARIAQAIISSIEGVQNAYTTAQASPLTTVFPAYPILQAATAAAFGLAQIKQIQSSQFKSSKTPSAPRGGGARPGVPQMAAPRLGGVLNPDNEITQQRKVYVVESDITSTQAKVSNTQKVSLVE